MPGEPKNQSSLTPAAPIKGGRAKSKFPSMFSTVLRRSAALGFSA
jgi:hypothetical protein